MRVAIERVEGVEKVEVTLADGLARVALAPGNRVTIERIRRVVRENGFTPKGTLVRVAGTVRRSAGTFRLAVRPLERDYRLAVAPEAERRLSELAENVDRHVVVAAEAPETKADEEPSTLFLHTVESVD